MIDVLNGFKSLQGMFFVIQFYRDGVIYFLLKIIFPRFLRAEYSAVQEKKGDDERMFHLKTKNFH